MLVNDFKTPQRPDLFSRFGAMLCEWFSLDEDKENEAAIIQSISRGIEFRGIKL